MNIKKIVLTGGPCGGKSAVREGLKKYYENKGYVVVYIGETATELILGGIAPWTCQSQMFFQSRVLELQMQKEKIFESAAVSAAKKKIDEDNGFWGKSGGNFGGKFDGETGGKYGGESSGESGGKSKPDILIICDRGALDGKSYMADKAFTEMAEALGYREKDLLMRYDAIFHLTTLALDNPKLYIRKKQNNAARSESVKEAADIDKRLKKCWGSHPYFRVIKNPNGDFKSKLRRLTKEIDIFLDSAEKI